MARMHPKTVRLAPEAGDACLARCLADVYRQRAALGEDDALALSTLLSTCGSYLARAGITPREENLFCGSALDLLCLTGEDTVLAAAEKGCSAVHSSAPKSRTAAAGDVVLALRAARGHSLTETAQRFWKLFSAYRPLPLANVGVGGLAPHLLNLPVGIELDLQTLADYDDEGDVWQALSRLADTLLITLPREAVPAILQSGAPATPIGRVTADRELRVRAGIAPLLSLPLSMLPYLHSTKPLPLSLAPLQGEKTPPALTIGAERVLGTVCVDGGVLPSCLWLLHETISQGAAARTMTLAATLTLPPCPDEKALANAACLALSLHRFCAELSIPTAGIQICPTGEGAPLLTVALSAKRGASPAKDKIDALEATLAAGDFSALRQILYG